MKAGLFASRLFTVALMLVGILARAALAADAEQTFDINEFRVLGNTVLPTIKVEQVVYPFLGPNKTIHTVEQARDALVAAYKEGGFGTAQVDIPEQTVDEGIVRLKVTEGHIEKVRISGAKYYSERRIMSELPSLKPGAVPQLPEFQAQLARLASESRDRQITPVLKAGSEPGTVAIDLNVKDDLPVHASLQADNRYTADTAHVRLTGNVSYDNLFQRNESISLQYQTAPAAPSEVKLWALTYLGRTDIPALTWSAYAIRSDSNVAALGTLNVIGNGRMFGGRLVRAIDAGPAAVQSFTFGVDYKDFGQTVVLPGDVNAASPIHYILWSGQYAFNHFGERFQSISSVAVNFGFSGVGGDDEEFQFKRSGATASFTYLRASTNLTWRLWRGISFVSKFSAQYSAEPLVNNEQFSLGGVDTVRGYLETEELVDSGVAGQFELHAPTWTIGPVQAAFYGFYDRGIGMVQQPLGSQIVLGTVRTDLYSLGAGLRLTERHGFSGTFEWADPRVDGSRTIHGRGRGLFSILYGF
jgi:hemolysin activation/secretion protein